MDLSIKNFRIRETNFSRIKKIMTPFSLYFWIFLLLLTVLILVNKYITSNIVINIILILISIVILFL